MRVARQIQMEVAALIGRGRDLLAPPLCLACSRLPDNRLDLGLCAHCRAVLSASAPTVATIHGLERSAAAVPYAGPAIGVVAALKSGRVPAAAGTAAELICETAALPPRPGSTLLAVPSSPGRRLRRGLDPAEQIAAELGRRLGLPLAGERLRRLDRRAQRGRDRAARLADPPRFEATATAPERVVLVDDVITTGATLRSCASALRQAGSKDISALCFALTPAPSAGRGEFRSRAPNST